MEDLFSSTFSSLPYFSPLMMINRSEICATTRLLQCRDMGISMNDVTPKFQGAVERATDLSPDAFYARKNVIEQVAKWCEENEKKKGIEWTPILYRYEVVKTAARKERDWGDLVFVDPTTTCFLLVMIYPNPCDCGNFAHHDYDAMTKYQANRLMSLVTYIYHKENLPKWVRATYTTPNLKYTINPELFASPSADSDSSVVATSPRSASKSKYPPIIHLPSTSFTPSLYASELEKIDNVFARSKRPLPPSSVRANVLGTKENARPEVSDVWKGRIARQCAFCEQAGERELMICSRCKLARYCNVECQKSHWPQHKILCKKAQPSA